MLLNDEVEGEILLRAPRPIQKGEPLYSNDLQHIEHFELPDELLDSGHVTIVRAGEAWHMFFNFLYGRAKAKDMLELAGQFLEAAQSAKDKGHEGLGDAADRQEPYRAISSRFALPPRLSAGSHVAGRRLCGGNIFQYWFASSLPNAGGFYRARSQLARRARVDGMPRGGASC